MRVTLKFVFFRTSPSAAGDLSKGHSEPIFFQKIFRLRRVIKKPSIVLLALNLSPALTLFPGQFDKVPIRLTKRTSSH